jgi:hypothetical protein
MPLAPPPITITSSLWRINFYSSNDCFLRFIM